jgi:hypothetical protein
MSFVNSSHIYSYEQISWYPEDNLHIIVTDIFIIAERSDIILKRWKKTVPKGTKINAERPIK